MSFKKIKYLGWNEFSAIEGDRSFWDFIDGTMKCSINAWGDKMEMLNIYIKESRESLVENDEIDSVEEAFMQGYCASVET